jgi:MFS family permease
MAAEHAPTNRRGLYAAIPPTGNALGVILATIVFTPFTWLPEADFHAWGWRIPFILSIVLLPIGIWIRRRVDETPSFKNVEAEGIKEKVPFLTVLRTHPKQLILGILASVGPNVATYVPSVYALTYITDNVGQAAWIGTVGVLVANVVKLVTLPFSGHLSDRLGRKPIFISGAILCALMSFPFFWMLDTGVTIVIWLALVILLTFSNDLMLGSQATLLTEQFTNNVRFSGVAASREISAALAGGTLPFIAAALTTSTHGTLAISLVMRGMSAISIIGAALLREGSGKKIS